MYIGLIRPVEERTADVSGTSLDEVHAAATAQVPDGFDLVSTPVRMIKGSIALTATATYQRRDGIREIRAEDREGLHAKVPEGWQLLSIRTA
ncbi:hypothetical protein AB3M83_06310 [Microbacterium sp. 179-B 1A2 NHS]|uniref:hypothetical protein n=1 Tax=Microbacterium sp. 179-B 1A2 NHS TaxID=3142383 RepID=UPI0039A31316